MAFHQFALCLCRLVSGFLLLFRKIIQLFAMYYIGLLYVIHCRHRCMTFAWAMYDIHFEFIAKQQVDCIAAIVVSKIRIARRDSIPVFQESAKE